MRERLDTRKKLLFAAILFAVALATMNGLAYWVEFIDPEYMSATRVRIPPKSPGTYRVFVFGGSTVHGSPVPELGFVAQLEFWLRRGTRQGSLEVFNFGVPGRPSSYARRMVRAGMRFEPDLMIVLSGHNEFLRAGIEGPLDRTLDRFALARVLVRLRDRARSRPGLRDVMPERLPVYERGSALFRDKVEHYARNLRQIVAIARRSRARLIFVTAPANLSDWPPIRMPRDTASTEALARAERAVDAGDLDAADRIAEMLQTRPDDATLVYLQARALAAAGRPDRASPLFEAARDLDPVPWRALGELNGLLRSLDDGENVRVLDAERVFTSHAPDGLVGFELMADNCHPTPLGNAILAGELIRLVGQSGWLVLESLEPLDPRERLEAYLAATTVPESRRALELAYCLRNAKYAMKTPFFNFEASRMYLRQAQKIDPTDWRIWANLATVDLLDGRIEEGTRELVRAVELKGGPPDPRDRGSTPYLAEALEASGLDLAAIDSVDEGD